MNHDPIRELLEDADLKALIEAIAAHPDFDHVTIVTLKTRNRRERPVIVAKHANAA